MATWDDVRAIALRLPEAEESRSYGRPAFRVGKKLFAWESPHEQAALCVRCDIDERTVMIATRPEMFFVTSHYANYPAVLVHLHAADLDELADRVEESWLLAAPKKLVDAYVASRTE